jgi:hypothetical protein
MKFFPQENDVENEKDVISDHEMNIVFNVSKIH